MYHKIVDMRIDSPSGGSEKASGIADPILPITLKRNAVSPYRNNPKLSIITQTILFRMKYPIAFNCIATAIITNSLSLATIPMMVTGYVALTYIFMSLVYVSDKTNAFSKNIQGQIPLKNKLILWPIHIINSVVFKLWESLTRESPYSEISKDVFLGKKLSNQEAVKFLSEIGDRKLFVLDLTSELSENMILYKSSFYKNIPVLDASIPTMKALEEGSNFIKEASGNGVVYVHCAQGHGRSALFIAAYLLLAKQALNPKDAENLIVLLRSGVKLNWLQRKLLNDYHQTIIDLNKD